MWGKEGVTARGYRVSFWGDARVLADVLATIAQPCGDTKITCTRSFDDRNRCLTLGSPLTSVSQLSLLRGDGDPSFST